MSRAGECPRALSAWRLGYEPEAEPDWLPLAAAEGKWHEQRIINELGITNSQLEVTLDYPAFTITGHIDGKLDGKLVEIKTMSQFEFNRWMRGSFDEFPEYADQLTCYMEATGLETALYLVKNRGSGYLHRTVQTIPGNIAAIALTLGMVEQAVSKGHLMPMEFDAASIRCRRCRYKYLCIAASKDDMTKQTEQELLEASRLWRLGKEHETQGKLLVTKAKRVFEEHCIAADLDRFRFDDLAISRVTVSEYTVPERTQQGYTFTKIDELKRPQ